MRRAFVKIDPAAHFRGWHYEIHSAFWSALGVSLRYYVDRSATTSAREVARSRGWEESRVRSIQVTYPAYVVAIPPLYAFSEGSLFHSLDQSRWLQVITVCGDRIEVHQWRPDVGRIGFQVTPDDLAAWLQSGMDPEQRNAQLSQSLDGKG